MGFGTPGRGPRSEINVTPLVDVVLVLLIIFLLIQPWTQTGVGVRLPTRAHTPLPTPSAVRVELDARGRILVEGDPTRLEELAGRLRTSLAPRASKLAVLAAADEASYAAVADVLDALRTGGAAPVGVVLAGR
jgi:biopolymer transport protein TolR